MNNEIVNLLKTKMLLSMTNGKIDKNNIYQLILLQLLDKSITNIPILSNYLTNYIQDFYKKREKDFTKQKKNYKSSILIDKYYNNDKPQETYNNIVESIINLITTLDYIKSLLFNGQQLLPNFNEIIPLKTDIYFKLNNLERDDSGKMQKITFEIFSYNLEITQLKNFLYECENNYNISVQNKLGTDLYFFDHHIIKINNTMISQHPPFLTYNKHLFSTNRTFNNIFFEQKKELENRINFFINNKKWYDEKGIPYTLGFLFYGKPGCGKTSTIKAIANITKRHIFNINLSEIRTKKQLKHLFFSKEVYCKKNGVFSDIRGDNSETFTIPISKRLYVIEDIDAAKSVASRNNLPEDNFEIKYQKFEPIAVEDNFSKMTSLKDANKIDQIDADNEEIDLTTLLNILDGTLETPERIIIVTTNYPEKLDNALIRPGRIDMFIEFKKCSLNIIKEFYENFYDKKLENLEGIKDDIWTPAEINQILFQCFNDSDKFLSIIKEKTPEELFKYSHY